MQEGKLTDSKMTREKKKYIYICEVGLQTWQSHIKYQDTKHRHAQISKWVSK